MDRWMKTLSDATSEISERLNTSLETAREQANDLLRDVRLFSLLFISFLLSRRSRSSMKKVATRRVKYPTKKSRRQRSRESPTMKMAPPSKSHGVRGGNRKHPIVALQG